MGSVPAEICPVIHCLLQQNHYGSGQYQRGRTSARLYLQIEAIHQRPRKSTCLVKLADEVYGHHDVVTVVLKTP